MPLAIFGITSDILNLVVTLVVLGLVAIWLALIVFTFNDARRRIADPFLVGCATAASLFPFIGTVIYSILRPPEFLEDVQERETELDSSDTQLRHLKAAACGRCGFPVEHDFMRCPSCRTRLKQPCPTCERPVGTEWKLCPYCETTLIAPKQRSTRGGSGRSGSSPGRRKESSKKVGRSSGRSSKSSTSKAEEAPTRKSSPKRDEPAPRRSRRSSRRKVVVPDEESGGGSNAPIKDGKASGKTEAPGKTEATTSGRTPDKR